MSWTEILPGVHAHDDRRGPWSLRSHAIALEDGTLAVISPTRGLDESVHADLARIGAVSLLVAPNHYHHLGVPEWMSRHRGARAISSDGARVRLAKQQRAVSFEGLRELGARLGGRMRVMEPAGLANGETWLRVETERGVAWLVGDAFFAHPVLPRGAVGLFFRLTDTAPGLKLGRTFTLLGVRDRKTYREWLLARLAEDRPRILVPTHGDVVEGDDLADRLEGLATARL